MSHKQPSTEFPLGVVCHPGQGDLDCLFIETPGAQAELFLQGAHLANWKPRNHQPVLWMSQKSHYTPGKPLRGGVPICLPWFGPNPDNAQLPLHGFARLLPWTVSRMTQSPDGPVTVELTLQSDATTREIWPHDFAAVFSVTIAARLTMSLEVTNTSSVPFTFTEALHTYLAVSDVRKVTITGLEQARFFDKAAGGVAKPASGTPMQITGETDRVYLGTRDSVTVTDPGHNRRLILSKAGSEATVLWNPWIAKAKAMPDFGDDEWPQMLCIETANAMEHAITLGPGACHTLSAMIDVEKLP